MVLSQKESSLLQDLKSQEQLCVEKYSKYSAEANCSQLSSLFSQIGQMEQQHLSTLNQLESGTIPQMSSSSNSAQSSSSSSQGSSQSSAQGSSQSSSQSASPKAGQSNPHGGGSLSASASAQSTNNQNKQNDSYLCSDILATEKHVSSLYNTCIFEFKDANIRNALNHIQKEEQGHGEQIYNYMQQNNMYS